MRRLWIGASLLLLFLIGGICSTVVTQRFHRTLSRHLEATTAAALAEDWEETALLLHQCHSRWIRYRNQIAAVTSHEPIEEIDSLYHQLDIYFARRDSQGFALCCATLHHRTQSLGETQSINWWNLL